ncbi:MAG: tetratricopeptide repeat protein [Elusimicrobia bacterium]|nr:tetratricopeptide repeat protein [Elusimicrobiota bacterium]
MKKIVFLMIFLVNSMCYANDLNKTFGVGLGYPYFSLKYGITSKTSIETRGAYDPDVLVGGLRLNHYFNPEDKAVFYISGEADYILFQSSWVEAGNGEGYAFGFFIGNEYFIEKNFTLNIDMGPVLIGLTDTNRDISSNGVQWVFNAGLNYYFSFGGEKEKVAQKSEQIIPETKKVQPTQPQLTETEKKEIMTTHFNKGTQYMKQGKYEWAIQEFQEVLKYDPNHQPSLQKIEKCKQIISGGAQ